MFEEKGRRGMSLRLRKVMKSVSGDYLQEERARGRKTGEREEGGFGGGRSKTDEEGGGYV